MRILLNTDLPPAAHWALGGLERALRAKDLLDETGPALHVGLAGQDTGIDRILAESGVHCPSPRSPWPCWQTQTPHLVIPTHPDAPFDPLFPACVPGTRRSSHARATAIGLP